MPFSAPLDAMAAENASSPWNLNQEFQKYPNDNLYHLALHQDSPEVARCKNVELVFMMGSVGRAEALSKKMGEELGLEVEEVKSDRGVFCRVGERVG